MVDLADDLPPTEWDRLDQAESAVRSYCGWHIAPSRDDVVTYVCEGSRHVILPSLYVTAVSSVTVDGLALDPTDYTLTESGVLTRGGPAAPIRWCAWWGTVVVSFTHGYDTVPAEVTGVVQSLAQRAVNSPDGRSLIQVGAVQYGETSASRAVGSEAEILNRYRLSNIA